MLEFGDSRYTRQFGGDDVQCEILNLVPGHAGTTLVGDVSDASILPEAAFDCIIAAQCLQYVYDLPAALGNLHRALRPGGVLLLTTPAISPMIDEDGEWLWSFSATALVQLLRGSFDESQIEVAPKGNAFAATCFVQGIALEEISPSWLEPQDPTRPILITARAMRAT